MIGAVVGFNNFMGTVFEFEKVAKITAPQISYHPENVRLGSIIPVIPGSKGRLTVLR